MNPVPESPLAAEARVRVLSDGQLAAAGWVVQDTQNLNLSAAQESPGAKRSWQRATGGPTTCSTSTSGAVGVIEAKPVGTPLPRVEWQSAMYVTSLSLGTRRLAGHPSDIDVIGRIAEEEST